MDKRNEGYVAGIICVFGFVIFLIFAVNNEWNPSGQILWGLTIIVGGLSVGCFWKPETIGTAVSQFLQNISKSGEGKKSNSDNKQVQKKSSGIQVMSHDQSNVKIIVNSEKKEQREEGKEQKEILRKEKIEISPSSSYYYEFEFTKKDCLKGEISSTNCIDIYFLDEFNFDKWSRGRKYFEPEDSSEGVLEANIDYDVPKRGAWYLIIENNGRKSATVKVLLY